MTSPNFWKGLPSLTWTDVECLFLGGVEEGTSLDFKSFGPDPTDKKGWPKREGLAKLLCAMAKTAQGRIVLGAESDQQDHQIRGFRGVPHALAKATLSRVHEAAAHVQPPAAINTKLVQVEANDEWVLLVEILPDRRGPRQVEGTYFMRVGSSNRPMPHSMVVAAILSTHSGDGQWHSEFINPIEGADMLDSGDKNPWQFGVWIHAPHQMPHLLDSGEEDGLDPLKEAYQAEGLTDVRFGVSTAGCEDPGKRRVRVTYAGAAWEVISSDFLTSEEHVPVKELGDHLEASVRRLARILKAVGYEQHVSVKVMLRKNAGYLLLKWEDGNVQKGLWASAQELANVLVDELIDPVSPRVPKLRRRFVTYLRRQAELHGSKPLV